MSDSRGGGIPLKRLLAVSLMFLSTLPSRAQNDAKTKELTARETELSQALVRGDWKAVQNIEADDLIFTTADGSITHKSDDVENLRSGKMKFESIDMRDVVVQDLGDVGVVKGTLIEKVQYQTTDISGTYCFTDVWAKRGGRWWLVAGHEALVPAK